MQQVELEKKNTIYTTSSIFTKKGSLLLYSYNLAFPPHHYCIGWKEVYSKEGAAKMSSSDLQCQ